MGLPPSCLRAHAPDNGIILRILRKVNTEFIFGDKAFAFSINPVAELSEKCTKIEEIPIFLPVWSEEREQAGFELFNANLRTDGRQKEYNKLI